MSVVFDSNIYISAFRFKGRPLDLVQMAVDREIDVAISQTIIDETLRVLKLKFGAPHDELERALTIMESAARKVVLGRSLQVVKDDPNDNHVIECAVAANARAIVTGDKDLLRLGEFQGIRIIRIADLPQIKDKFL